MSRPDLIPRLQPLVDRLRTDVHWRKRPGEAPVCVKKPLTEAMLARHCNGGPAFGAAPIAPGTSVTLVAVLDFDAHKGESTWDQMRQAAATVHDALTTQGYAPLAFRSSGGHGIHLYLVWDTPQDAYSVRAMLEATLASCGFKQGTGGVAKGEIEVFPKQDAVPQDGYGNMFIIPLAQESVPLAPELDLAPLPKDTPFTWTPSPDVPVLTKPEREQHDIGEPSGDLAAFKEALDAIPNTDADPLTYDAWRNIIFSIHHATGGSDEGLELAHAFSARSGKYDSDFLDTHVWPYITSERDTAITDRYVLSLAAQHGWIETAAGDFLLDAESGQDAGNTTAAVHPFTPIQAGVYANVAVEAHWLIKDLLPAQGMTVIYGASGSGKTFFALDMAMAIARGVDWRNRKVKRGRVVYVAAEGSAGFRRRLRAYALFHECDLHGLDLHVIAASPSLLDRAQASDLAKYVHQTVGKVYLTFFDTMAKVTAGGNENSGEDMGKALRNLEAYQGAVGGAVVLIHHSGKDETRGARGWSGIKAAVDAELEVTRSDRDHVATLTKLKDGEDGAEFSFRLMSVPLGFDEDNEPITSCVVSHGDIPARMIKARKRMGEIEKAIYEVVGEMPGWTEYDDACEEVKRRLKDGDRKRNSTIRRSGANLFLAGLLEDNGHAWKVKGDVSAEFYTE